MLVTPKTPTELSKGIGKHRSAISRSLIDLESRGLVKCLTPDEKVFRYYEITQKGKKVLEMIGK